ncbi:MAG: hypothetical protein GY838_12735, partial [bacterium]|nr:hypothetical protein [bacterium]
QGSNTIGSAGVLEFKVSPSERAAQVLLDVGWESIRLYPFPEQVERGHVLGPAGGSVSSPGGVELLLPEGALPEKAVVKASLVSSDELAALPAVLGFDTLAAVRIELDGHTLAREATLSLNSPDATPGVITGDPRIILAQVMDMAADDRGGYPRLVAPMSRIPGTGVPERLVATPELPDSVLPLDGITREGLYLVLYGQGQIGFATGFVRASNGVV